jgi:hypothetical protein
MSSKRFQVSIFVDLVVEPTGELVLGLPGSSVVMARLAPGMRIDEGDAQILARAWARWGCATLSPTEADHVLAGLK